ncbi:hypothetical protein FF80_00825 [Devosia sp. LC5]|nr:hypothetical protein FF80_00825 [Devosia sp. LC5]
MAPALGADAIAAELKVTMNQMPITVPIADYLVVDFDLDGQIVPMGFSADPEISKRRESFFAANPGTLPAVQLRYLFYLARATCSGEGFLLSACESRDGTGTAQIVQMVLRSGSVPGVGTQMLRPAELSPADVEGEVVTYDQPGWSYMETLVDGSRLAASCAPAEETGWGLTCRHSASLANGIFYQVDFLLKGNAAAGAGETLRASHAAAQSLTSQ